MPGVDGKGERRRTEYSMYCIFFCSIKIENVHILCIRPTLYMYTHIISYIYIFHVYNIESYMYIYTSYRLSIKQNFSG